MTKKWPDRGQLLDLMAAFRPSCVLGAAAELDLFDLLGEESLSAQAVTQRLGLYLDDVVGGTAEAG